jgi:hypothetical protein
MDQRKTLISMLLQLREDMLAIQQLGAGYYSCTPIIKRYNKLLAHAKSLVTAENGLLASFEAIEEDDPLDPGDKMKVVQSIRIEIGQLLSLIENDDGDGG